MTTNKEYITCVFIFQISKKIFFNLYKLGYNSGDVTFEP